MSADRRGFALVTVLWLLVVMGGLLVNFQRQARAERLAVANTATEVRARWAARAGLALGLDALDAALTSGGLNRAGGGEHLVHPFDLHVDGVTVEVTVRDPRARMNINSADAGQLQRLFAALDVESADLLAQLIVGRRSVGSVNDSLPTFDAVERLGDVDGMSPAVFRQVIMYLTVTGDGRVNVNAAPAPVLLALPGMSRPGVRALLARRAARPFGNAFEVIAALPERAREALTERLDEFTAAVAFGPRDAEVVARARIDGVPGVFRMFAVVRLVGGIRWELERIVER